MVFKLKIDYYHILYLIVFRLRKRCKSANKTSHLFDNVFLYLIVVQIFIFYYVQWVFTLLCSLLEVLLDELL